MKKGFRSTDWWLQNSPRNVKHSIGNIANNIVITIYGARKVLEISGESLCKLYNFLTTRL